MKLKCLIFDVDGTLAESERDGHRVAFNLAFADAGLNWQWDVEGYGNLLEVAGGKERLHHYITRFQPQFSPSIPLEQFIARLHRQKTNFFQQLLAENAIPLRPGVRRLLAEARQQGVRLAIASTAALENVEALLQTALAENAPSWFEVIAAGDVVAEKKPAPDIYLYVLRKMGLSPADCLVIEDSSQGLAAAARAGLSTVITVNEYTRAQDFRGAALVLNHLGEPDLSFAVLRGEAAGKTFFDLDLAQDLLESYARPQGNY